MTTPKIQLLLTGNELMTGDIVDSNSAMIAEYLKELGLKISRKITIADDLPLLINEINQLAEQSDILIINGGLGPTVDDLTTQALAKATKVVLTEHIDALKHVTAWCKKRGVTLNTPNLKQAMLPQGCEIIANRQGSAVGFKVKYFNCDIYCTPGVPHELKTMLIEQIKPDIAKKIPTHLISDVTRLQVFGLGESTLQKMVDEQLPDWPSDIELGFRAGMPLLEIKLTTNDQQ
nr:competence/damage-inducible protein A [Colwellia sp.]